MCVYRETKERNSQQFIIDIFVTKKRKNMVEKVAKILCRSYNSLGFFSDFRNTNENRMSKNDIIIISMFVF